jgi:ATP-dependent DNA ligase
VDHGFDTASAKDLRARLKPLIRKAQPYSKKIAHRGIWVEPSLLAEIECRAKSAEGKVRHPSRRAAEAKTPIGNVNYGASSGPARQRRLRRNWIVLDPVDGPATDASYLRDLTNPG